MTPKDTATRMRLHENMATLPQQAQLRVLATTDIHMQLVGFDYVTDLPVQHHGFAGLATLIKQARQEAADQERACVLLDNGDLLQGNAMGDFLAAEDVQPRHPVAAILNHLNYDAVGVGNHDLDHGLPYLNAVASRLEMPVVATNLSVDHLDGIRNDALIKVKVPGSETVIKVGILSLMPAQTAIWNRSVLREGSEVTNPIDSAQKAVVRLRKKGAQIIILLAHMGIKVDTDDSALTLARLPGVDAIITGHTHRRFPGTDHAQRHGVDSDAGLLANRPAVMPGHSGSDLAVMDLSLEQSAAGKWRVARHQSDLRRNGAEIAPDPRVTAFCTAAHTATRSRLAVRLGQTGVPLHTYFTLATPTKTCALIARANARAVRDAVRGLLEAELPILAMAPAHTAGGRGGPEHYLNIAKGDVLRRHLAGLSPYVNAIWAIRVTGRDLRRWLEHAAKVFAHLKPGCPDQPLNDRSLPIYNFDTIFGLRYRIDPSQPIGMRIHDLSLEGAALKDDQSFLLATNQFRAVGGGGLPNLEHRRIALPYEIVPEDALISALQHPDDVMWPQDIPWHLGCDGRISAVLNTCPAALDHLSDIAHLSPQPLGTSPDGFARIRLTF